MKHIIVLIQSVFLTACFGTAHHDVALLDARAFNSETKIGLGTIVNKTGKYFDFDIEAVLEFAVVSKLVDEKLLAFEGDPNSVVMDISIIRYRKGNAFIREFLPLPGFSSTELAIEAFLFDSDGNLDAKAKAKRSVDWGGRYTVGAWRSIFDDLANDLIEDIRSEIRSARRKNP
jgi:hypothetical protein